MIVDPILIIILGISCGVLFFIVDIYEHKHPTLNSSLIAGISLAYFFLLVLPEISEGLPEYPLHLEMFEYLFVLIGFCFVHVSEKFILQKIETRSQSKVRKLIKMEKTLELVEKNIEIIINNELGKEELDKWTLKHLTETLSSLNEQSEEILPQIEAYKKKIQDHISKDLEVLRFFTNYFYHFIVGIIVVSLLSIDLLAGVLFFIFAFFKTVITNRSEAHIIFTDLEIYEKIEENKVLDFISSSATITGVLIGFIIIFEVFGPIDLEVVYILFSFIAGVILYHIVREVIPEKEKGDPVYFLIGLIGFILIIFFIKMAQHTLH